MAKESMKAREVKRAKTRLFKSLNLLEKETQFSKKDDRFDRFAKRSKPNRVQ